MENKYEEGIFQRFINYSPIVLVAATTIICGYSLISAANPNPRNNLSQTQTNESLSAIISSRPASTNAIPQKRIVDSLEIIINIVKSWRK